MLAVIVGCGLRRSEVVRLEYSHILLLSGIIRLE